MPQPNKGKPGKANVAAPIKGAAGSKPTDANRIHFGVHTKGTKGKGTK